MAGNDTPRLVQILIQLDRDWWSIYRDPYWQMNELELVLHKYPERQPEFDAAYKEFEAHPFWEIVRLVSQETGLSRTALKDAAHREFDGRRDLVIALNELDTNGTTTRLLTKLYDSTSTPTDAKAGGIGPTVEELRQRPLNADISDAIADADQGAYRPGEESPSAKTGTNRKRPGRKKANFETQQREALLAADWEQAHDTGVYKADFAKQKGLTLKDLERLLGRVRKNKARADK